MVGCQQITWARDERFEESWKLRIRRMATHLGNSRSVIDYGSGPEWLRESLPPGVEYFPCDYKRRSHSTIVCNFNDWEFPCVVADAGFVSGCLEYVVQPEWFIEQVSTHSELVVMSYCTTDAVSDIPHRRRLNWVNNLSEQRLIEICRSCKLQLTEVDRSMASGPIFVFRRTVALSQWAVLSYRRSPSGDLHNVGDYIQSMAAACLANFEISDAPTIDREHLGSYVGRPLRILLNGWFSHSEDALPPSASLSAEVVSFHLSHQKWEAGGLKRLIDWLRSTGPIGCRDVSTLNWAKKSGVPAYLSGCITPLVGTRFAGRERTDKVVIVDPWLPARRRRSSLNAVLRAVLTKPLTVLRVACAAPNRASIRALFDAALFVGIYGQFLSDRLIRNAEWRTHLFRRSLFTTEESVREHVRATLSVYAGSAMVITSRIHAALPCLGMGTPVLFVSGDDGNGRFQGLVERFSRIRLDNSGRAHMGDVAGVARSGVIDGAVRASVLSEQEERTMLDLLRHHEAMPRAT
jgi:hypothetical protein